MGNKKNRKYILIILILLIVVLLYLLIRAFGHIENRGPKVPTGNVDIFEISCICDSCNDTKAVFKDNSNDINKNKSGNNYNNDYSYNDSSWDQSVDQEETNEDLIVEDNYKIWDNKKVRIFSNPAYEYESIIAPGSENSYAFVIRNNNNFDVTIDISFEEVNEKNINMQYKLKNHGKYLIGTENNYESIKNKKVENIKLSAKSQKPYILDWKWLDSDNDTLVGFDINSNYKLLITVGANQ